MIIINYCISERNKNYKTDIKTFYVKVLFINVVIQYTNNKSSGNAPKRSQASGKYKSYRKENYIFDVIITSM